MRIKFRPVLHILSFFLVLAAVYAVGHPNSVAFAADRMYTFNMGFDGNQGNLILVESNGQWGLMDGGHRNANTIQDSDGRVISTPQAEGYSNQISMRNGKDVAQYMINVLGVTHLDFIVGTHSHMDHIGGIPEIATTSFTDSSGRTRYLVDSNTTYFYKEYQHIADFEDDLERYSDLSWHNQAYYYQATKTMQQQGANMVDVSKQQVVHGDPGNAYGDYVTFTMGNMTFRLYNVYEQTNTGNENVNSIVTVMTNGNYTVVNLSDINTNNGAIDRTSEAISKDFGSVDVVVAGHHGYAGSNTKVMFDELQPDYVVISNDSGTESWLYTTCDLAAAIPYANGLFGTQFFSTGMSPYAIVTDLSGNSVYVYSLEGNGHLTDAFYKAIRGSNQNGWVSWMNTGETLWMYLENGKPLKNCWHQDNGKMYYLDGDGIMQTGWLDHGRNSVHYMDPVNGYMLVGWQEIGGKWYYFDTDQGEMQYGWQQIGGKMYYLNDDGSMYSGWLDRGVVHYLSPENGAMVTGWVEDNGNWYYFEREQGEMVTGWQQIDGKMYFFNNDGRMYTGWLDRGKNSIHYLSPETGVMHTGWLEDGGKWYYFDTDQGEMQYGWVQSEGKMYYLNDDDGSMYTGWLDRGKNAVHYLSPENGAMVTGWLEDGGKWYYFEKEYGTLQYGWVQSEGKMYYLSDKDGSMYTGWLDHGKGAVHYLSPENGAMVIGWQKIDGNWYYFDTDQGTMADGWQQIDGKMYFFNEDGSMKTGWTDDHLHYIDPETGTMATGWLKIDGVWHYFETEYGQLEAMTGWQKIGDKMYFFDDEGNMVTGWLDRGAGNVHYMSPEGPMVIGWLELDGNWYYFETDQGCMLTGWQKIDDKMYYLNDDGSMVTGWLDHGSGNIHYLSPDNGEMAVGWLELDGNWYYFEKDQGCMVTGWQKIDGKDYFFYDDGTMARDTTIEGYYLNGSGVWER